MHVAFSLNTTPHLRRRLRHVLLNPKTDLEKKKKNALIPDEESHGLEVYNENNHSKKVSYFRQFGVIKEPPSFRKPFRQKKVYLNTSISEDFG